MFQWKEEYRIDGDVIDREHQHLFELANQALAIVDPSQESKKMKDAILEIYKYTEYHFENEEKKMREADFPEYEEHAELHRRIIREMNSFLTNCHEIKSLAAELRQLMVRWVVEHIMEEDRKFADYIRSQIGVS